MQRLKFTVSGEQATAAFFLVAEGDDAPSADAVAAHAMEGEARLQKHPGRYFLKVTSTGAQWSVVLEEVPPCRPPGAGTTVVVPEG